MKLEVMVVVDDIAKEMYARSNQGILKSQLAALFCSV